MLKGINENNQAIHEGLRFILSILLIAGILFLLLNPLELQLQAVEAELVQSALHVLGTSTRATDNPIQFLAGEKLIEISALCSGLMEIILLIAAIAATRDASWRKKIMGIIFGVGILFAWNILRMLISIQQLLHTSLEFAEFTHGVLFRVMLVLGFAFIYLIWLRSRAFLESGREKKWW